MRTKPDALSSLSEEKRKALEAQLDQWIDTAAAEKADISRSWDKNRSQYNCEPLQFISKLLANCKDKCYPFSRPRIDSLNDYVHSAIFGKANVLAATIRAPEGASITQEQIEVESMLDYFFDKGALEEVWRSLGADIGCTNHGIIRKTIDPFTMLFKFDPIPPDEVIVLGSGCYNMRTALMAGHAFYPTISEVLQRVKSGEYQPSEDDYQPNPYGQAVTENATERVVDAGVSDELSQTCQLYFLSFRCDVTKVKDRVTKRGKDRVSLKEETYTAVFDKDKCELLTLQLAPSRRHPYYTVRNLPAPTRGYWSRDSTGFLLQGLHDSFQICKNLLKYGSLIGAFPPILSKGPLTKDQVWGPAKVFAAVGGEITMPNIRFDPGMLQPFIDDLKRDGDAVVRISQAGMGQESTTSMTATQAVHLASGQAKGVAGVVSTAAMDLIDLGLDMLADLEAMYPQFYAVHGDALPSPHWRYGDHRKIDLDATGASPNSNPAVGMQNILLLNELASGNPEIGQNLNWPVILKALVDMQGWRQGQDFVFTPEQLMEKRAIMAQQQALAAQGVQDSAAGSRIDAFDAGFSGKPAPYSGASGESGLAGVLGAMPARPGGSNGRG